MPFVAGFQVGITWRPVGQGSTAAIHITGHSWSEMIDKLDVTTTAHGGVQAIIAGIFRGEGNLKGNVDSSEFVWTATLPEVQAATNGLLSVFLGTLVPATIPCMVTKLVHQSTVEGKVEWNFDVSFNILAAAINAAQYGGFGAYGYAA